MTVTFWFDPTCPYTWNTGRWLRDAAAEHGDEVEWRLMSLAVLNADKDVPEQYQEGMRQSRLASRVLAEAGLRQGNEAVDALYTALGRRLHEDGGTLTKELVAGAVADAGLPTDLLDAYEDSGRDSDVEASHEQSQRRAGQESGSPVIAFGDGPGYFGPIVTEQPTGADSEKLYEAMKLISAVPQFAELKRAR
ncbi:MAG TPA: DsbA family protein [Mycobacteriales bacterium]|jgi:2-hydroxychromene-2-carboxylate isomerase|nr:DsbA family protein [Mycobacteriales bacterium]